MAFHKVFEPKTVKNRMHLDLSPTSSRPRPNGRAACAVMSFTLPDRSACPTRSRYGRVSRLSADI